jgi:uncharacterized protein DUF1572
MLEDDYIRSAIKQFTQYRLLGEKAIGQVPEEKMNWQYNPETNSIAVLVKHLSGNMHSRFTDFFTSDGEKEWRNRDAEFENENLSANELMTRWDKGWNCLFSLLTQLSAEDLSVKVLIRNEEHTVMEAINRQLTHYAYHVGQIVFVAKMIKDDKWKTLSIPRGASKEFNTKKGL